jgi:hypothetical protein
MTRLSSLLIALPLALVNVTACTIQSTPPAQGPEVVVDRDPPAEQVEAPPPAPSPQHVWIKGHWRHDQARHDYVWVGGHWEGRPRPASQWVPGRWDRRHGGWVWIEGRWE